ncbi:MAG: dTMP kinase [Rubellimicrobium sp.]|nr:dTMP kinase [Rubellimicrobium sp.]
MAGPDGTGPDGAGLFVSFEGIDGCGKSTQSRLLEQALKERGHDVLLTREPGGSPGAEAIRGLLLTGAPDRWSPETEILLFTAARRDHLERSIRPALSAGRTVVTDRFADSTRVYQGAARAGLQDLVDRLHALMIGCEPDLTLLIDMDPELALARGLARASGEDRFEEMGLAFQQRLRRGFLDLAATHPDRICLIDGNRPPEAVAADVVRLVLAHPKATILRSATPMGRATP